MTALTLAGSIYLLWLGLSMLRNPPVPTVSERESASSRWAWLIKGVCVSGLNPKVFLLFLALLPQFTDHNAAWPIPAQITTLGMIHVISCGVVYLLVGYGSHAILRTRPQAARWVSRVSGIAMMVIAVGLIASYFNSKPL